jgi:hypothetical protein
VPHLHTVSENALPYSQHEALRFELLLSTCHNNPIYERYIFSYFYRKIMYFVVYYRYYVVMEEVVGWSRFGMMR